MLHTIPTILNIKSLIIILAAINRVSMNLSISLSQIHQELPTAFVQALLQGQLSHCHRVVLIHDSGLSNDEVDLLVSILSMNGSRVLTIGRLEPDPKEPWIPSDADSVRKYSGQTEASTVRNIEMENMFTLSMPASQHHSHREAIFVMLGRQFTFEPTLDSVPDFPVSDPTAEDPLSYLSERMLQLKIILERRRHSYFVFWSRYLTESSMLLHPKTFILHHKIEAATTGNRKPILKINNLHLSYEYGKSYAQTVDSLRFDSTVFLNGIDLFPKTTKLRGDEVIISTGLYMGWLEHVTVNGKVIFTGGVISKVINEAARRLNFKYSLIVNQNFGFKRSNGTFEGCTGDVYYGRADMVAANEVEFFVSQGVDTYQEHNVASLNFVTALPQPILEWSTVFKPFALQTWLLLMFATIFLTIVLRLTVSIMRQPQLRDIWHVPTSSKTRSIEFALYAILNQLNRFPVMPAIRPIAVCWLFFSLLVIVMFSGNLIAFFIYPLKEPVPNTLEELVKFHQTRGYRIGYVNYYTTQYDVFSRAKSGLFKQVFEGWETFDFDPLTCIRLAYTTRKLACINHAEGTEVFLNQMYLDDTGKKLLHIPDYGFLPSIFAMGFRLEDRIGPLIGKEIQMMGETGLFSHWHNYEKKKNIKMGIQHARQQVQNGTGRFPEEGKPKQITLGHLYGLFIVVGILMGISFIVSMFEISKSRFSAQRVPTEMPQSDAYHLHSLSIPTPY